MATGQLYYRVRMSDGSLQSSSGVTDDNFFGKDNNLVSLAGATRFTKLGVQAPPGTKIVLNNTRTIMIGRTGIYEIEAEITNMYIIRLVNYVAKTEEEIDSKREGLIGMISAVDTWYNYLHSIEGQIPPEGDYNWTINDDVVVDTEKTYETNYQAALDTYMTGYNGIYEQSTEKPFVDVENIIIDYQYE